MERRIFKQKHWQYGCIGTHGTALNSPNKKDQLRHQPKVLQTQKLHMECLFCGGMVTSLEFHGISSLFHRKKSAKVVDAWTPIRHSNQPFDPTQNPSLHVVQTEHLPQPGKQSEWMIRSSKVTWKAEFNYTFEDEHISSKLRMVHLPLIPNRCIGLATSHLTFKTIPL